MVVYIAPLSLIGCLYLLPLYLNRKISKFSNASFKFYLPCGWCFWKVFLSPCHEDVSLNFINSLLSFVFHICVFSLPEIHFYVWSEWSIHLYFSIELWSYPYHKVLCICGECVSVCLVSLVCSIGPFVSSYLSTTIFFFLIYFHV